MAKWTPPEYLGRITQLGPLDERLFTVSCRDGKQCQELREKRGTRIRLTEDAIKFLGDTAKEQMTAFVTSGQTPNGLEAAWALTCPTLRNMFGHVVEADWWDGPQVILSLPGENHQLSGLDGVVKK